MYKLCIKSIKINQQAQLHRTAVDIKIIKTLPRKYKKMKMRTVSKAS